jgi:Zn-dependent protease with chaperone function
MPRALLPLVLTLVLPLVAVTLLRLRALRAGAGDSVRAWFEFGFGTTLLALAAVVGWLSLLVTAGLVSPARAPWALHPWLGPAASALLTALPPQLVLLAMAALSHDVSARLRGPGWSRREALAHAAWRSAGVAFPLAALMAAFGAGLNAQWRPAALLMLAAVALRVVCERRRLGELDLTPHAITHGDLRDRVMALAAAAGVKLRMLYVMPTARGRVANALAVQGGIVMFTDLLLQRLSRREVDAVLAHELAHLRRGHPRWLLVPAVTVMVFASLLTRPGTAGYVLPLASAAAVLATVMVSRRLEYQADRGAVELTRDPEAMISALAALARLNDLPLEWGPLAGALLTHPSMVQRARAIGRDAGLEPARVAALLRDGLGETARHALPVTAGGKVFSTRYKAEQGLRIGLTVTAAMVAGAALVLLALALSAPPRLLTLAAAALAAALAGALTFDLMANQPYARMRRALAARLGMEGLDVGDAQWVGLTLTDRARLYEGYSDWDVGFLWIRGDRLCFVGEEVRFSVRSDEVVAVRLGARLPGWIRAPRVVIDRRAGSFSLRPAGVPRVSAAGAAAYRLLGVVGAWVDGLQADRPVRPHPLLDALPPLEPREVTALTPREFARPRTLAGSALVLGVLAAVAGALLGLPSGLDGRAGVLDAWGAALIAAVMERLPWWRWRERGAEAAAPADEHRRAA